MRRLFIAGAPLALMLLSACSDGYTICSAPIAENCRTFRSRGHYERWVKDESRRQLAIAEHFPDDYRDIVAATLKEYLQNNESEFPNHRVQFFVSVFGEDADAATLARLRQLGLDTFPGSSYIPNEPSRRRQDAQGKYLESFEVYVSNMRRLANGEYRVEFGYYCGMRCAGHFAFRLHNNGTAWVFTSKKALGYF